MSENYIVYCRRHRGEDDGAPLWEAWHPRLPGCRAMGDTPDAAHAALAVCRISYLQALAEAGQEAPLGDTAVKGACIVYVHEHA